MNFHPPEQSWAKEALSGSASSAWSRILAKAVGGAPRHAALDNVAAGPLKGPAALLSGGLSLGIDSRKIFLPRIVHGARSIGRTANSLMSSSRSGSSGDSCEKVKPKLDLVVRERERHAVVIGSHQFIRFVSQDRECGSLNARQWRRRQFHLIRG
jgi:hypothetical protein